MSHIIDIDIEAWWKKKHSVRKQNMGDKKKSLQGRSSVSTMSSPGIPNIHGIHPPVPLDTTKNIIENWKTFKQSWENYSVIMNINTQPEAYKVALFLHCIGPEAVKIYNGLSFETPEEKGTLSNIIAKFNDFTIGKTNKT